MKIISWVPPGVTVHQNWSPGRQSLFAPECEHVLSPGKPILPEWEQDAASDAGRR